MKRYIFLTLALVSLVGAQTRERVQTELERTDAVIERVTPLVERSGSPAAELTLREASEVQRQAWEHFRNRRQERAYNFTLKARDLARRAALLAEVSPDRVEQELRRTAQTMEELGPEVLRAADRRALEFWKMAENEQARARRHFTAGEHRLALKLTLMARYHARTAGAIVRRQIDPDRIRAEMERTDQMLERAAQEVKAVRTRQAEQVLDKARNWQEQARNALSNRYPGQALRFTYSARELLLRAWEMARGATRPELVEQALDESDKLLEQWSAVVRESGSTEARRLLEQAVSEQLKARLSFENRDLRGALQGTTRARRLANRAVELIQPGDEIPGFELEQE